METPIDEETESDKLTAKMVPFLQKESGNDAIVAAATCARCLIIMTDIAQIEAGEVNKLLDIIRREVA